MASCLYSPFPSIRSGFLAVALLQVITVAAVAAFVGPITPLIFSILLIAAVTISAAIAVWVNGRSYIDVVRLRAVCDSIRVDPSTPSLDSQPPAPHFRENEYVFQQVQQFGELYRQIHNLTRATEIQQRLARCISHELRNPFCVIQSSTKILSDAVRHHQVPQQLHEAIHTLSVGTMGVSKVLDLMLHMEVGEPHLVSEYFPAVDLAESARLSPNNTTTSTPAYFHRSLSNRKIRRAGDEDDITSPTTSSAAIAPETSPTLLPLTNIAHTYEEKDEEAPSSSSSQYSIIRRRRILFVDDVAIIRKQWSRMLEATNLFHVTTAIDGLDFLNKCGINEHGILDPHHINKFDAIIVDGSMPNMNGVTAIRIFREYYPNTPVLGFTGNGVKLDMEAMLNSGANDVFIKGTTDILKLIVHWLDDRLKITTS